MKTVAKKKKEGEEGFAFTDEVLEIHGNVLYMRCSKECCTNFYLTPTPPKTDEERKRLIPICKKCGANMKPHCMFFDESY